MQPFTNTFKLVFASSSGFTLPILEDIIESQGKTLYEIYQKQCTWINSQTSIFEKVLPISANELLFTDHSELQLPLELVLVISQPESDNRGKVHSNPIVKYAREVNLPLFTPIKLNNSFDELVSIFDRQGNRSDSISYFDTAIVASYGQIISSKILALAKHGYINWHPSLLPLFRGPTPMPSLIEKGVDKTGLSWIEMTKGMDAGDIWLQTIMSLSKQLDLDSLTNSMVNIGLHTWAIPVVAKLLHIYSPIIQDQSKATFTKMLNKQDRWLDPNSMDSESIYRRWLAYKKYPGVSFMDEYFQGEVRLIDVGTPIANHEFNNIVYQDRNWVGCKAKNLEVFLKTYNGYLPVKSVQLSNGRLVKFEGYQFKNEV